MDLRRRLVGSLSLLLAALLAGTALVQLYSLRADVAAEVRASSQLVTVLLAAGTLAPDQAQALQPLLAQAGLRHLSIRTEGQVPLQPARDSLSGWLGLEALVPPQPEQQIRIGQQTLYIAPYPHSEISERLADTVRLWSTLLFFSGTTLLVAWWSADRALRPVRELEASLHRLARGEPDPALPQFDLREFGRVARAIDHLAQALGAARVAQQALARQLIKVREDEKRTLARELHDEMGQTLTALNVTAAHLERHGATMAPAEVGECAVELRRELRTCSGQLRGMLKTLRPHGLSAHGLQQALADLLQGWRSKQTAITFELLLPAELPAVDEQLALVIYRVVQEALTNVVRHSGAVSCTVQLQATAVGLQLDVMDDGCGLPSDLAWQGGLLGMRERISMVDGQLQVWHGPAGGLHLHAQFPVRQQSCAGVAELAGVTA
ncbi:histidine kinase [Pseudoduganella danionis]|uniref:sensor histidine kinase n=1 Tax=Pseudoduganella danionis TaxID=1890295 RepID=UPI0035B4C912